MDAKIAMTKDYFNVTLDRQSKKSSFKYVLVKGMDSTSYSTCRLFVLELTEAAVLRCINSSDISTLQTHDLWFNSIRFMIKDSSCIPFDAILSTSVCSLAHKHLYPAWHEMYLVRDNVFWVKIILRFRHKIAPIFVISKILMCSKLDVLNFACYWIENMVPGLWELQSKTWISSALKS